jgi:predicted nucleic acid-binding protein
VRFWDTSAIVPLCVQEPASNTVERLLREDPAVVVWWITRLECLSAMARRGRDRSGDDTVVTRARRRLRALAGEWSEVVPSEPVRLRAERVLTTHALRTADALQLSAALLWSRGDTSAHAFVCLDDRLRDAARREGFVVLPN